METAFHRKEAAEFDKFNSQLTVLEKEVNMLDAKADPITNTKSHLLVNKVEIGKKKSTVKEIAHVKPKVVVVKKKPEEKRPATAKLKSVTSKKQNQVKIKKVKKTKKDK